MTFLSRERRLNHLYKIIDKQGKEVTFKFNKAQKRLFDMENKIRKEKWRVWLKLLKARQIWFTTYKLIDKLDKAIMYSNTTVNIVAHRRDKLQDIFQKVKFMYDNIPDVVELRDWRQRVKPQPKYDNRNELYFPKPHNSKIKITLDSRSWTLTDCHISEGAFIDNFRAMLRATIPSAEQADITIETTANGMNEFKEFWDEDDRFEEMFFPWFEQEEYQQEPYEGYVPMQELQYLQDKYDLTDAQMYWYEQRYKNDKDGTLQEYPSEPIDAFISTGRPFYNNKVVKEYPINTDWVKDIIHEWLLWYNTTPNNDAMFWIDLAEWLDHWDYTTIRVRDRKLKLICTYKWHIDPADACKIVNYIHNQWIKGIVAPERNNHWHTFIEVAKWYSRYRNIYVPEKDNDDKKWRQVKKLWKRGWETNLVTRPIMLDEHKQVVDEWIIEMDKDLQEECFTFIKKNGKPQADNNCHDDIVMADAICCQMTKHKLKNDVKPIKQKSLRDNW